METSRPSIALKHLHYLDTLSLSFGFSLCRSLELLAFFFCKTTKTVHVTEVSPHVESTRFNIFLILSVWCFSLFQKKKKKWFYCLSAFCSYNNYKPCIHAQFVKREKSSKPTITHYIQKSFYATTLWTQTCISTRTGWKMEIYRKEK